MDLDNIFSHHAPKGDQVDRYQELRLAGKQFAKMIERHTPPGADQAAAIRKVREAVMTANAAIALDGKL
ncbi:MAG: hypothetical protein WCC87_10370 [Candidatus Korobacteraceae bacterium]